MGSRVGRRWHVETAQQEFNADADVGSWPPSLAAAGPGRLGPETRPEGTPARREGQRDKRLISRALRQAASGRAEGRRKGT